MSLTEAVANVVIGYGLAVVTPMTLFPLFDLRPSLGDNLLLGAVFTGVSLLRSYIVRRSFENWCARRRHGAATRT